MAATLWKIYDFFVRVPDGRDEKPDSAKSIDVRVPCGRDEKPYSEKSVDLRVPSGRDSQKSVDLRVAYGRGEKPDSEERFTSNPFLPLKYKLKAVKVYTRHVGQEVFWDKKLGRHRTFKELQKDPEIRREIKEYIICRGLEQFGMNLEKLLGFVNDKELNFRINAESCWDSMELEYPATLEELGMDPENKGIISDFLRFVRDKELCKSDWMNEKLINWLVYDSPSTNRSSVIAAMANYLKFNVYHLDLTSFSSFDELEYTLLSTRNRSVIAIEGLYQCAGMLLNLKTDDKFAVKHLLNEIDALFLGHNNERIFVFTINHRDQHVAASLHPVGMDIYIHTSLLQPIALPDGGNRTLNNSLLVSNSEKENKREAVKVYSRQGRDCSHSMEVEQPPTLAELGKDPDNEGIISDLLNFVRDKELYKRIGKKWKRGYLLHESPSIDRSSLIAAMANYLELDIYDLDLTGLSSIWELQNVLLRSRNRSLIAIKDFNHWFGMHPNLKNEVLSLRKEKELTLTGLLEIIDGLVSCCWDQQIIVLTTNHNQRDPFHTALLHPLNINAYMHTSSPQPLALPDGGEIVELDSLEQKLLANFDATNEKAYQSGVLVFHSEKKNTREASKGQCMKESALSLVDSTTRISSMHFNAPDYKGDLVRAYQGDPFTFNSEKKGTTEGECLTNSVLSDDDSTKQNSLPDCTSLASFPETIEDFDDFDDGAGMLPNLKDEFVDGLFLSCGDERIIECTTNHRERDDAALPPLVDMDTYIHMASPQSVALPDGGEIVQLDSSEQKPLGDFDATSNRVYQSDVLVPNSEGENTREASRRQCMPKSVLSLVDSMTRISSKNFDAPNSSANLERAYQSGPIVFNSKEKDSGEGLNRECLTKSVLSLDDSSRQKSLLDVDTTKNKTHLVRAYQQGLDLSLSEHKNRGEALKRECITKSILCSEDLQQHSGVSCDDAAKNFGAIYDVGIHMIDSLAQKSLKVVETLPTQEEPNDSMRLLSIGRLPLEGWVQEEKSPNLPRVLQNVVEERVKKLPICLEGLTAESARASHWPISLLDGRHTVVLHPLEQSTKNVAHAARVDQCSPTMSLPENKMVRKTLKRKCRTMSVTEIHQPYFGRRCDGSAKNFRAKRIGGKHVTNRVSTVKRIHKQHGIHQWPFRQKWATRKGYSTGDERSFEVSSLSTSQCAEAGENGPTVSNSEKGNTREALKRNSLKDLRQHFGARDSLTWNSFEVLDSLPLGERSNKRCVRLKKSQDLPRSQLSDCSGELAAQSAIGLPNGGHIPSLLENKIVRNTLKRKCRTMSVLGLEDHQQHVGRSWEDDANFLGAKRICRQLAIDCKSPEKCIRRQQGTHQCQFKQSAGGLQDRGCMLSLSKKKIVRKTLKRKRRTMSVINLEYHQHVDNRWEDAVKSHGSNGAHAAKRVYRKLVIHHVSSAKRIHRQPGIYQCPFQQKYWATMKGNHLVDERLVEVTSLCVDVKLVLRLQRIHTSWLGRFSRRPSDLPGGGEFVGPITLSSSEFAATNNRAHHVGQDQSGATASHSKNKRTREQEDREEINKTITLNDLRQHYGRKRKDAADSLGISVSTLKRISRLHGITRWPNIIRQKVLKPPDPHGETNPSATCEKLSTNRQIEMENDPAPSQPMPTIPHITGSSDDWRSLLASQEEPFLEGHVCGSSNWAAASCYDPALSKPLPTMPHTMGSLNDWRNLLASQEEPLLEGDVSGNINWVVASCFDPTPIQPLPTSLQTMGTSEDWSIFLPSQEEPFIEGHVSESINWIVPPCSNLDPIQPMSTNPYTMPTIPLMTPTRFMKLKAIYGDTTIKFQLPLTSGINELKKEVSKILEFEHGSFNIEYKDEDGDWILMARDENVREYLQLLNSLGNQVAKLKIRDKVPNTTNFCETCGTLKHNRP